MRAVNLTYPIEVLTEELEALRKERTKMKSGTIVDSYHANTIEQTLEALHLLKAAHLGKLEWPNR